MTRHQFQLTELGPDCLADLAGVLDHAGLPSADLTEPGRRFYRLDDEDAPIGWAGLEPFGPDALLRSVVMAADRRGSGVGHRLVAEVAAVARGLGVERLWLLTTTAAGFFARLGFEPVDRAAAPDAIRGSREFRDICSASATCMTRAVTDERC